jgi:hypothetical protein
MYVVNAMYLPTYVSGYFFSLYIYLLTAPDELTLHYSELVLYKSPTLQSPPSQLYR